MKKTKSVTNIETKIGVKLSPQQILLASMLQATPEELQRIINDELEKNVALESDENHTIDEIESPEESENDERNGEIEETDNTSEELVDRPDYSDDDLPVRNQSEPSDYSPIANYGADATFRESLKEQLGMLEITESDLFLANYIVDSLEDDGYLRRPLFELVDDLAWNQNIDITEDELRRVLTDIIQANLEPAGIGARNLRECLLLQIDELQSTDATLKAYRVLDEAFEDFKEKRFERIKERFDYSDKDIAQIQKIIQHLNPRPGGISSSTDVIDSRASVVRPDFFVTNEEGTLVVSLYDHRIPAVRISPDYIEMLHAIEKENANNAEVQKGKLFIESGIRAANLFINSLVQRRHTMLNVMRALVEIEHDYFLSGNIEDLKPIGLKDVAERSKYDVSTVSRVCGGRFVQTDFGIIPLKELFSTAVSKNGGKSVVSNVVVKNALKELVDNEDKENPYNDDELMKRLEAMGYKIARRTVVKYRDMLGIPKSNLRKK